MLVLFHFYYLVIISMNRIRTAELKVKEADSGIDVALTKRYDVYADDEHSAFYVLTPQVIDYFNSLKVYHAF